MKLCHIHSLVLVLIIMEILFHVIFVLSFENDNFSEKLVTYKRLKIIFISLVSASVLMLFIELYCITFMNYGLFGYCCILILRCLVIYVYFIVYYRFAFMLATIIILVYFIFRFVLYSVITDAIENTSSVK